MVRLACNDLSLGVVLLDSRAGLFRNLSYELPGQIGTVGQRARSVRSVGGKGFLVKNELSDRDRLPSLAPERGKRTPLLMLKGTKLGKLVVLGKYFCGKRLHLHQEGTVFSSSNFSSSNPLFRAEGADIPLAGHR